MEKEILNFAKNQKIKYTEYLNDNKNDKSKFYYIFASNDIFEFNQLFAKITYLRENNRITDLQFVSYRERLFKELTSLSSYLSQICQEAHANGQ